MSAAKFYRGQYVAYLDFITGEVLYRGTTLTSGHMHQDYDGDGPATAPYRVYPVEHEGCRGSSGYWPESSMVAL